MEDSQTEVLIIGAGPSGLALATELTMRGRRVHVVEKNDRTGIQPRAKTTNVRTMTHMRRWGLAGEVRKRSPLSAGFPRRTVFQTSLFSGPIFSFEDAFCASPRRRDEFPEHAEFIPQYVIEGILAEHVARHPLATLRFGSELIGFEQDDNGVTAMVRDAGRLRQIRAGYIVGADGARSSVRRLLGIRMQGQRDLVTFATLILRLPGLIDDPALPKALFHWIVDPAATCVIGPMDHGDLWYCARVAGRDTPTDELLAVVGRAIGREVPLEVAMRDDWVVHSLIAERYRQGRAFLAGDSCHLHSPFGGHGMNLGIGDAVDLGWKLAAALEGWGSEGLLESYETERRQMHLQVIDSATKNVSHLSERFADPILGGTGVEADSARARAAEEIERLKAPEFRSLGLVLGNRYGHSPALAPAEAAEPPLDITRYTPMAAPGHLAPHAWLDAETSLYDLFGKGFTLLVLVGDGARVRELLADAEAVRLPLDVLELRQPGLRDLYGADLVLVRPDQHVAWRGDSIPPDGLLIGIMRGDAGDPKPLQRSA
ncbi:FAD-dependent monooxygenase [Neorhizobium sp. DT-125]|uniref:FAD-dependent monooxygenase n=1 Tax=Neorhizobium sp. DT-125 TaxID=3396163 RepID=UPI003F1D2730